MRLERYFFTGLLVLLPLAVTAYLGVLVYNSSAAFFTGLLRLVGLSVPAWALPWLPLVGLASAAALVVLVGMLATNLVGRRLLLMVDHLVNLVPLVRDVYNAVKQIAHSLLGHTELQFSRAALIEYPRKGTYALCFVVQPVEDRLAPLPEGYTVVVVPTSPVPASGFVLVVPTQDLIPLDIRVEEAIRFVVSVGFLLPEDKARELQNGTPRG